MKFGWFAKAFTAICRPISWDDLDRSRWLVLRRVDIGKLGSLYLRRYFLVRTPWFGIFVHLIARPDQDRDLHDHPWPFTTFVLCGGYYEVRSDDPASLSSADVHCVRRFRSHRFPLSSAHRITYLLRDPTWTLVFTGAKVKEWGFWVPRGDENVWVRFDTYLRVVSDA